jgi:Cu(I)/Ag(I) efflux system membrane fusion protein
MKSLQMLSTWPTAKALLKLRNKMRSIFTFILSLILIACTKHGSNEAQTAHEHAASETYTCPMHPQVVSDKPGKCPVCGMDLVRANKERNSNDLMLSDSQIRLANITTQKVSRKLIGQSVAINGRLTVDAQKSEVISSRAGGRIEKLVIKETGQAVRQGQALYTLYSETLLTLQQEYLLAKEQFEALGKTGKQYKSFLDASEKKLLLYGLTKNQINQLTDRSSLQPRVTFLSPAAGIVTEIKVSEGQYVSEGSILYRIEDVSTLWVEAELYPGETEQIKIGDKIAIHVSSEEGSPVDASVSFISPEYRANSQITVMKASIANPDLKFKPGQQVQVDLTHSAKEAIALPVDAVIRDGRGSHVYVKGGNNTFRPRVVSTGIESVDQVEITDGLNVGDTVVISGAYLLYSEFVLKRGTDPMVVNTNEE